ncbi:MAG: hypothetical protein AMXMBFR84_31640 [Candidatus Hydrogenedentota bacterium]
METRPSAAPLSRKVIWAGRILSALPALLLLFSAVMKIAQPPGFLEGFAKAGFPEHLARPIGVVELGCVIIYLIPRTQVLGAILITAYMGGAVVTHVRLGEAFIIQILVGVLAWGGLFLRDRRIRSLIPVVEKNIG